MVAPVQTRLNEWRIGAVGVSQPTLARIASDSELLSTATNETQVLAAALSIIDQFISESTSVAVSTEATLPITEAERARLRELALSSFRFAEGTIETVDKALEESRALTKRLEVVQSSGHRALNAIADAPLWASASDAAH